jgi:hypothetical protein
MSSNREFVMEAEQGRSDFVVLRDVEAVSI